MALECQHFRGEILNINTLFTSDKIWWQISASSLLCRRISTYGQVSLILVCLHPFPTFRTLPVASSSWYSPLDHLSVGRQFKSLKMWFNSRDENDCSLYTVVKQWLFPTYLECVDGVVVSCDVIWHWHDLCLGWWRHDQCTLRDLRPIKSWINSMGYVCVVWNICFVLVFFQMSIKQIIL